MPWGEKITELDARVTAVERAQREDHEVLAKVVERVQSLADFVGTELPALRQQGRDTLEAVDGLHTGAMEVARAASALAKANLEAIPAWAGKIAVGMLAAVFAAILGDIGVHWVARALGW